MHVCLHYAIVYEQKTVWHYEHTYDAVVANVILLE